MKLIKSSTINGEKSNIVLPRGVLLSIFLTGARIGSVTMYKVLMNVVFLFVGIHDIKILTMIKNCNRYSK